jgi:hypothetical protein
MQDMKLNMAVFERDDPWEATFYLGKFFGNGGVCRLHDDFNWVGAAFICSSKANNILSAKVEMVQRLAWAFLAILINESLASSCPDECSGQKGRAMLDRVNMIVRFGDHPNDYICDLDTVVDFYLGGHEVQEVLKEAGQQLRTKLDFHSNVRLAAEELSALVLAARLKREGQIDVLISQIENAVPKN